MQTRRDFIKSIVTLFAAVPLVGIPTSNGIYAQHIQRININVDLGRQPVLELGRNKPYYDLYISPEALEAIRKFRK